MSRVAGPALYANDVVDKEQHNPANRIIKNKHYITQNTVCTSHRDTGKNLQENKYLPPDTYASFPPKTSHFCWKKNRHPIPIDDRALHQNENRGVFSPGDTKQKTRAKTWPGKKANMRLCSCDFGTSPSCEKKNK